MVKLSYPPPADADDFEDLCLELLKAKKNAPDAAKNGRRGHRQDGVDVYGRSQDDHLWYGVQAKTKEFHKKLSLAEVKREIEKAERFRIKISHLYVATTAKRDPNLQKDVAEISESRGQAGTFTASICSWDECTTLLNRFQLVADSFYENVGVEGLKLIARAIRELKELVSQPGEDYGARITEAADHITSGQPDTCITLLNQLRQKEWDRLTARERYRLLANIGNAYLAKNDAHKAVQPLLDAHRWLPDDDDAKCAKATALVISGDKEAAHELMTALRVDAPDMPRAAWLWIRSAPPQTSMSTFEDAVSEHLRADSGVASALADHARGLGDFDSALQYAQAAASAAPDKYEPKAYAAFAVVEREADRGILLPTGRLDVQDEAAVRIAIQDMADAIEHEKQEGLDQLRLSLHANRAAALNLLGCFAEAEPDVEAARAIAPEDSEVRLKYALVLQRRGRLDDAIEETRQALKLKDPGRQDLLLASLLERRGSPDDRDDAITFLSGRLSHVVESDPDLVVEYTEVILRHLCHAGRFEDAHALVDGLPGDAVDAGTRAVLDGQVFLRQSDKTAASGLAASAVGRLSECDDQSRARLAQLLQSTDRHAEALDVWADIVPHDRVAFHTYEFLECAIAAGEEKRALQLCEQLRLHGVYDSTCLHAEVDILQELNVPDRCIALVQEHIEHVPDDVYARLRLSLFGIAQGRPELVDANPDRLPAAGTARPPVGAAVVAVLRHGAGAKVAGEYAYRLLRQNFNSQSAHQTMIAAFLEPGDTTPLPTAETVEPGTAVELEFDQGNRVWRIIENECPPEIAYDEISESDPIAQSAMGKRVGDTIEVGERGTPAKILSILTKEVFRAKDSMEKLHALFPTQEVLRKFDIPKDDQGELDAQAALDVFRREFSRVESNLEAARERYRNTNLPLNLFALAGGRLGLAPVSYVVRREDLVLRCCVGTADELAAARAALESESPVVITPSALATLFLCGADADLPKLPAELLVTRGAVADIRGHLQSASEAGGTVVNVDGEPQIYAYSDPAVQQDRTRLREFLAGIEEHTEVRGGDAVLEFPGEQRKPLADLLGQSVLESIAIAKTEGAVLWTDDLYVAHVAQSLGVRRVWSQSVFWYLEELDPASGEAALDRTLFLLEGGYVHTGINAAVLIRACTVSDWDPSRRPLVSALQHVGSPSVAEASVARLIAEALPQLVVRCPSTMRLDTVLRLLASSVTNHPQGKRILRVLHERAYDIFGLDVVRAQFVRRTIADVLRMLT